MTQSVAEVPVTEWWSLSPTPYRVVGRREEAGDVATLFLEPCEGEPPPFRAGQFNMLTAFGIGEAAISVSSPPGDHKAIAHTVRDVGPVTHALWRASAGSVIGVRGPFGTDWGIDELGGRDVVVVAGGIGLAPLRGALCALAEAIARRAPSCPRRLLVLIGARSPDQVVFPGDLERWRSAGAEVEVTVDIADPHWSGRVGVVTALIEAHRFDTSRAAALVCGPEVMMRFTARALLDKGVESSWIRLSLERNMQCGIGLCGHCQLGPLLLCRDGPVVSYAGTVPGLVAGREL